MVEVDEKEFVLADIPGLIEGAHEGAGLGDRFLGHVERCAILLHLIDGTDEDVAESFRIIRNELTSYGHDLDQRPTIIGLNKCDALTSDEIKQKRNILEKLAKTDIYELSGATGSGVKEVLRAMSNTIGISRALEAKDKQSADNDDMQEQAETAWSPL